MTKRSTRIALGVVLVVVLVSASLIVALTGAVIDKVRVTGYFANSNGVFVGDDVRILGVSVGKIERIEPQGTRVRIYFWYDKKYPVPADAKPP